MAGNSSYTKKEIESIVKDVLDKKVSSLETQIDKLKKESINDKEVRKMIRASFLELFKYLWLRSSVYIDTLGKI